MEHSEATEKKIAEGYVLGELLPEERDAFEEHFFGCVECAENVSDAAIVLDSLKVELQPQVIAFPSRWTNWWATAATVAAVAFGSLFGYQTLVTVPRLASGGVAQVAQVELAEVRSGIDQGSASQVTNLEAGKRFVLMLSIPPQPKVAAYRALIRKGSRVVRSYAISAEEAKNFVPLTDPGLGAGDYELVIQSEPDQGQAIATHSLKVR